MSDARKLHVMRDGAFEPAAPASSPQPPPLLDAVTALRRALVDEDAWQQRAEFSRAQADRDAEQLIDARERTRAARARLETVLRASAKE